MHGALAKNKSKQLHILDDGFLIQPEKAFRLKSPRTQSVPKVDIVIGVGLLCGLGLLCLMIAAIGHCFLTYFPQQPQTKLRSLSQQTEGIVGFFQYLLNSVSQLANILKIIFQLTALLFIITDLVNFWNLASIYIFVPVQIPQFAKDILVNVWLQFNQPILSFFNVQFDVIAFKDQHSQSTQAQTQQYKTFLHLNVPKMAFEPLVVLCVTAVELFFLSMILKQIKKIFRKLRDQINSGIKIQDVFVKSKLQKQKLKDGRFLELFLRNKKVLPIQPQNNVFKCPISRKFIQQSTKNIFDNNSSYPTSSQISQPTIQLSHHVESSRSSDLQTQKQQKINRQLKFMFIIHKLAENKVLTQKKLKNQKHWSETISVDKLQILSALLISFMPVLLLPLYNTLCRMKYTSLVGKINLSLYLFILAIIFIYPFVYLTAKLSQDRKRIGLRRYNINKINRKTKESVQNIIKRKTHAYQTSIFQISLKQQTFQTFFLFFMNMTIPICAGMTSTPIWFLSVNIFVHLLFLMSSITLFSKQSCSGKVKKYNKIIQKTTFLLYHLCFFCAHIFNKVKHNFREDNILSQKTLQQIDNMFGMLIISIFAFGGLHQMLQFLITILYDVFKIFYMIIHVIVGGYDIRQLQNQMKILQNPQLQSQQKQNSQIQIQNNYQNQLKEGPKNTMRSLEQLSVDFQIQIVKNQIILNKMMLQRLKHKQNDSISQINLAEIKIQSPNLPKLNQGIDKNLNQSLKNTLKISNNKQNIIKKSPPKLNSELQQKQKPKAKKLKFAEQSVPRVQKHN